MIIRRATCADMPGINKLLMQVLMVPSSWHWMLSENKGDTQCTDYWN